MKRGAVVMMDALGFKGIWERHEAGAVLSTMKQLASEMKEQCEVFRTNPPPKMVGVDEYRIEFASDSVLIAVSTVQERLLQNVASVCIAALLASRFLRGAAVAQVPLAYRGCITFGEFLIDAPFLVGPAIDLAATNAEKAEAGLVWVHPTAFESPFWRNIQSGSNEVVERYPLVKHTVPLKAMDSCETLVVSPFDVTATSLDHDGVTSRIAATFGAEHRVKRDNTLAFLRRAAAQTTSQ